MVSFLSTFDPYQTTVCNLPGIIYLNDKKLTLQLTDPIFPCLIDDKNNYYTYVANKLIPGIP